MSAPSIPHIRLGLALLILPGITTSCILNRYTSKITETIPVQYVPAAPIHVTTRNGSIEIVGGSEGEDIVVRATITASGSSQGEADDRLDRIKIRCERDRNDRLVIRADFDGKPRGRDGVSYVIEVPDADGAHLRTSNGSVKVRAIAGMLDVESSNGKIDVNDHSGEVKARTSNGSVAVRDVSGPVDVHTSNGSVTIDLRPTAEGPLGVRTSNGRVNVSVGKGFCGKMEARTSNGRVYVKNESGQDIKQRVKKRSGTIHFPGRGKASKVRSSNGTVTITVH